MDSKDDYAIHLDRSRSSAARPSATDRPVARDRPDRPADVMFEPLRLIDVPTLAREATDGWYNQILCRVNDSVVRVGVFRKGELHWHKHDNQDEMFFVLEGQFIIELETETITLEPHQGFTVPRGVLHRTRAPQRAVILIIEGAAVQPTEGS